MKIPKKTRSYRLGAEIQKIVGEFLRREIEPYFPGSLVTVTEIRVSDDFKVAGIYVSINPAEDTDERDIQRAAVKRLPGLRKAVAQQIRMRKIPEFRFFWDDTLERADRIEQLLNQIHSSQSPPEEEPGAET